MSDRINASVPVSDGNTTGTSSAAASGQVTLDLQNAGGEEEKETVEQSWNRLAATAPLNAFRSAIDLNRIDLVKEILSRIKSGTLKETQIIRKPLPDATERTEQDIRDDENANLTEIKSEEEDSKNNKKKGNDLLESIIKLPVTISSCILASEHLLEEELAAHVQAEQQVLLAKRSKKGTKDAKKKEEAEKKKEDRLNSIKVRRGDSNLHRAINAACLAAQAHSNNPAEILALLLSELFPSGDTAVAVNLDDLSTLDNQLAIKTDKNSGLEIKNRLGSTPLHHAASHISAPEDCIKLLLKYGADISARNLSGSSPLHAAAYIGNIKACGLLLEAVQMTVRLTLLSQSNFAGLTPRDYARTQALKHLFENYVAQAKSRPNSAHGNKSARSRPSSARPKSNIVINNETKTKE